MALSKTEEKVDFSFSRDLDNNTFSCDVMTKSDRFKTTFTIKEGECYLTVPLHTNKAHVFKYTGSALFVFTFDKQSDVVKNLSFSVVTQPSDIEKKLRKLLDRSQYFGVAEVPYQSMQTVFTNESMIEIKNPVLEIGADY